MKKKLFGTLLVMVLAAMPITVLASEATDASVNYEEMDVVSVADMVITENTKLSQDKVVTGDLYVKASLDLNGFNLEVKGNVFAESDVLVDSGEKLTVAGNYLQEARYLEVNGGTVTIGGDFGLYTTDDAGKKAMGTGTVRLFTQESSVTVGGDMILNTDCNNGMTHGSSTKGTFILKGDLIQEHSGAGFAPQNIVLAGEGDQTLSLLEESNLGNLQVKNDVKIQVTNWFNASLGSDITVVAKNEEIKTSALKFNGYHLQVDGNVQANGDLLMQDGSKFTVNGDYIQKVEQLEIKAATVAITGDLLLHSLDDAGKKVMGTGHIILASVDSAVSIDGDMIMNTDCYNGMWHSSYTAGTITLKGDLIQEHAGVGFRPQNLILAGTEEQTLNLLKESYLGNLQVKNNVKIQVTDWFNAGLGSDVTVVAKNGTINTNSLVLNGKALKIEGNLVADANIEVGSGNLKVRGDYWQKNGGLKIGNGQASVSKDLYLQNTDESGKAITGESYLEMKDSNGSLKVGGTMLLNTTAMMNLYVKGKISVNKDIIQKPKDAIFWPAYIYMGGTGAQKISFESTNAKIGTLELGQHISKYTFSPAECANTIEEVVNPFADVDVKSWQFPYVKYALDNKLMTGKGTDKAGLVIFDPNKNMTRAEFVQTLYNKEGKPSVSYSNVFTDVPKGSWFTNAVMWAYQNDIVKGKGDKFDVNGNITREEMATILYKYAANHKKYEVAGRAELTSYTDVKSISNWATENMKWAIQYGIMKGKGTQIAPRDNATRAECATMLRNFIMTYED